MWPCLREIAKVGESILKKNPLTRISGKYKVNNRGNAQKKHGHLRGVRVFFILWFTYLCIFVFEWYLTSSEKAFDRLPRFGKNPTVFFSTGIYSIFTLDTSHHNRYYICHFDFTISLSSPFLAPATRFKINFTFYIFQGMPAGHRSPGISNQFENTHDKWNKGRVPKIKMKIQDGFFH